MSHMGLWGEVGKAALEEGEHYLQGGRRCLCCCDTEVSAAVWSTVCLSHHIPRMPVMDRSFLP